MRTYSQTTSRENFKMSPHVQRGSVFPFFPFVLVGLPLGSERKEAECRLRCTLSVSLPPSLSLLPQPRLSTALVRRPGQVQIISESAAAAATTADKADTQHKCGVRFPFHFPRVET